ncbi:hypothetical protein HA466_0065300 [Hirschfeldia incana]|nr:hypothetical protein HA466_0065300 [Hirschfeldia incana]
MSSAAVPNVPAAADAIVSPTSFNDLSLGRSGQCDVARLLHFWDSRNIKKQGEFMENNLTFPCIVTLLQAMALKTSYHVTEDSHLTFLCQGQHRMDFTSMLLSRC